MKPVLMEQGYINFKQNQKKSIYKLKFKFEISKTLAYFSGIGKIQLIGNYICDSVLIERFKPFKNIQECITIIEYDELQTIQPVGLMFLPGV